MSPFARHIVLYTRDGCHLCHESQLLLARHGVHPQIVDIDADPELSAKFNECVPVLEVNGKVRFRGRINEALLRRLLVSERTDGDAT